MYVAELIAETKYPPTEIHLSHNLITEVSAEAIFHAVKRENQDIRYYSFFCTFVDVSSKVWKFTGH